MRYTTYREEREQLATDRYDEMKEAIQRACPKQRFEEYTVRKLQFAGASQAESIPDFYLCIKNNDDNRIYLEKKFTQGGLKYRACVKLTREECERILSSDIEWMKAHKKLLLRDFYLQITLNNLSPAYLTEYIGECGKGREGYVTFYKKIMRGAGIMHNLFAEPEIWISCLEDGKVQAVYKKKEILPGILSSIYGEEEPSGELAFAV